MGRLFFPLLMHLHQVSDKIGKWTMNKKIKDESGIALVISLLIMVLLTILGTAAIMTSTTDVKISENFKRSSNAFYVAEAGIEAGVDFLGSNFSSADGWSSHLETWIYGSASTGVALSTLDSNLDSNAFYKVYVVDDEPGELSWITDEDGVLNIDKNKKVVIRSTGTYGNPATATVTLEAYVEFDQGYDSYGGKDLTSGNTNVASGEATWD